MDLGIPASAVDALIHELVASGWSPAFLARAKNYVDAEALKAADLEAERLNHESAERALRAALEEMSSLKKSRPT